MRYSSQRLALPGVAAVAVVSLLTGCGHQAKLAPTVPNPAVQNPAGPDATAQLAGLPPEAQVPPGAATGPQTFQPYTVVPQLPPAPAAHQPRHGVLHLTNYRHRPYLADKTGRYYDVGHDARGQLIPVYHVANTGTYLPLYYDRSRDTYYRVARDDQGRYLRNYVGEPGSYYRLADRDFDYETTRSFDQNRPIIIHDNTYNTYNTYYEHHANTPAAVRHQSVGHQDDWLWLIPVAAAAYLLLQPHHHTPHAQYVYTPPVGVVRPVHIDRQVNNYGPVYIFNNGRPHRTWDGHRDWPYGGSSNGLSGSDWQESRTRYAAIKPRTTQLPSPMPLAARPIAAMPHAATAPISARPVLPPRLVSTAPRPHGPTMGHRAVAAVPVAAALVAHKTTSKPVMPPHPNRPPHTVQAAVHPEHPVHVVDVHRRSTPSHTEVPTRKVHDLRPAVVRRVETHPAHKPSVPLVRTVVVVNHSSAPKPEREPRQPMTHLSSPRPKEHYVTVTHQQSNTLHRPTAPPQVPLHHETPHAQPMHRETERPKPTPEHHDAIPKPVVHHDTAPKPVEHHSAPAPEHHNVPKSQPPVNAAPKPSARPQPRHPADHRDDHHKK